MVAGGWGNDLKCTKEQILVPVCVDARPRTWTLTTLHIGAGDYCR